MISFITLKSHRQLIIIYYLYNNITARAEHPNELEGSVGGHVIVRKFPWFFYFVHVAGASLCL